MKKHKNMEDTILFLTSPQFQESLLWIKLTFYIIGGILLGMVIFALIKTDWLKYRFIEDLVAFFAYRPLGVGKLIKQWNKIVKKLELGSEDEYKLAVLEAEEMLAGVLEKLNYPGENLRERLDKLPPTAVSNIEEVKNACQVHNKIVYDPNYRLSLDETKKTLDIFGQTLKDLQVF